MATTKGPRSCDVVAPQNLRYRDNFITCQNVLYKKLVRQFVAQQRLPFVAYRGEETHKTVMSKNGAPIEIPFYTYFATEKDARVPFVSIGFDSGSQLSVTHGSMEAARRLLWPLLKTKLTHKKMKDNYGLVITPVCYWLIRDIWDLLDNSTALMMKYMRSSDITPQMYAHAAEQAREKQEAEELFLQHFERAAFLEPVDIAPLGICRIETEIETIQDEVVQTVSELMDDVLLAVSPNDLVAEDLEVEDEVLEEIADEILEENTEEPTLEDVREFMVEADKSDVCLLADVVLDVEAVLPLGIEVQETVVVDSEAEIDIQMKKAPTVVLDETESVGVLVTVDGEHEAWKQYHAGPVAVKAWKVCARAKSGLRGREYVHPHPWVFHWKLSFPMCYHPVMCFSRDCDHPMKDLAVTCRVKPKLRVRPQDEEIVAHAGNGTDTLVDQTKTDKRENTTFENQSVKTGDQGLVTGIKPATAKHISMASEETKVAEVFNKRLPVIFVPWSTGDDRFKVLYQGMVPGDVLMNQHKTLVEVHTFFRGDAEIEIQLNGNKFACGLLWAGFLQDWDPDNSIERVHALGHLTAYPHVLLDASSSNSGKLRIPWVHLNTYFNSVKEREWQTLGDLALIVFNPLQIVETQTSQISATIWISWHNVELHVPCFRHDCQFPSYDAKRKKKQKEIEAHAGTEDAAVTEKINAPGTKAVNDVKGGAADRSMPTRRMDIQRWVPNATTALNFGKGVAQDNRLSLFPGSETVSDASLLYNDLDDMDMLMLAKGKTLVWTAVWNGADTEGSNICTLKVGPGLCYNYTPNPEGDTIDPTMLGYVARASKYWCGGIVITVYFVTSMMHCGRCGITYSPGHPSPSYGEAMTTNVAVVDIQERKVIRMKLDYQCERPYLRGDRLNQDDITMGPGTENSEALGVLSLWVVNRLILPESVASEIEINIFYEAADDFRMSVPTDLYHMLTFGPFINSQYLPAGIEALRKETKRREKIAKKQKEIEAHAYVGEHQQVSREDPCTESIGTGGVISKDSIGYHGDHSMNLHAVIERKCLAVRGKTKAVESLFYFINSPMSFPVNYAINDDQAYTTRTLLAHFSTLYAFWSGSIRYTFVYSSSAAASDSPNEIVIMVYNLPGAYKGQAFIDGMPGKERRRMLDTLANYGTVVGTTKVQNSIEFEIPFYSAYGILRTAPYSNSHYAREATGTVFIHIDTPRIQDTAVLNWRLYQSAGNDFKLMYMRPPPRLMMIREQDRYVLDQAPDLTSNLDDFIDEQLEEDEDCVTRDEDIPESHMFSMFSNVSQATRDARSAADNFNRASQCFRNTAEQVTDFASASLEVIIESVSKVMTQSRNWMTGLFPEFDIKDVLFDAADMISGLTSFFKCDNLLTRACALATMIRSACRMVKREMVTQIRNFSLSFLESWYGSREPNELPEAQAGGLDFVAPVGAVFGCVTSILGLSRIPTTTEATQMVRMVSERLRVFNFATLALSNVGKLYNILCDCIKACVDWVLGKTSESALARLQMEENFEDIVAWSEFLDSLDKDTLKDKVNLDLALKQKVMQAVDQAKKYNRMVITAEIGRNAHVVRQYCQKALEYGEIVKNAKFALPVRVDPYSIRVVGAPGIGKSGCVTVFVNDVLDNLGYPHENRWISINPNEEFFGENYQNQFCTFLEDLGALKSEAQWTKFFYLKSNNAYPLDQAFNKGQYFNSDLLVSTGNKARPTPACVVDYAALARRFNIIIKVELRDRDVCERMRAGQRVHQADFSHLKFSIITESGVVRHGPMTYPELVTFVTRTARDYLANQRRKVYSDLTRMHYVVDPFEDLPDLGEAEPVAMDEEDEDEGEGQDVTDQVLGAEGGEINAQAGEDDDFHSLDGHEGIPEAPPPAFHAIPQYLQRRAANAAARRAGDPPPYGMAFDPPTGITLYVDKSAWRDHEFLSFFDDGIVGCIRHNGQEYILDCKCAEAEEVAYHQQMWQEMHTAATLQFATITVDGVEYPQLEGLLRQVSTTRSPTHIVSRMKDCWTKLKSYLGGATRTALYWVKEILMLPALFAIGFFVITMTCNVVGHLIHKCVCAGVRWMGYRCGICGKWPKLGQDQAHNDFLLSAWRSLYPGQPYKPGHITTLEEEQAIRCVQRYPKPLSIFSGSEQNAHAYSQEVRGGPKVNIVAQGLMQEVEPEKLKAHFGNGGQNTADVISSLSPYLYRIRRQLGGILGHVNCVGLAARYILIPAHLFMDIKRGDVFEIYHSNEWLPFVYEPHRAQYLENKDICIYDLPERWHLHRNILKHFVSEKDIKHVQRSDCTLIRKSDVIGTVLSQGECESVKECNYTFQVGEEKKPIYVQRLWKYGNVAASKGDCGSLLISHNNRVSGKILGTHCCGNSSFGWSTLVTREMLEPLVTGPKLGTPCPEAQGNLSYLVPPGHFGRVGTMYPKQFVVQSDKSDIIPTKIHGLVSSPTTFPSVLSPRDSRLTVRVSPLSKGIAKYSSVPKPIAPDLLEFLYLGLTSEVDRLVCVRSPAPLSISEAITGLDEYDGYEPLDMRTSPGWPYVLTRPCGAVGKAYLFDVEKGEILGNELAVKLDARLRLAAVGERVQSVWMDCLKDERRPLAKIQSGSTRVFTIPPVDFSLFLRMISLDFAEAVKNSRHFSFSKVGIDPQSLEWTQLYSWLAEKSNFAIAGDFTAYDGTIPPELIFIFFRLIYYFYERTSDPTKNQKLWNSLMVAADELVHTVTLAKDQLYITHQGNPSGNPLTVILNSFVNIMYLLIAYFTLARNNKQYDCMTFESFWNNVRCAVYGDDNLLTVSAPILDWYNQTTISAVLAEIGITYTNSEKSGVTPFQALETTTFLKQAFGKHENFPYLRVPLMSENTILELLNWTRISTDSDELLESNCRDALRFAYFYGEEYFNKLRSKIVKALQVKGLHLGVGVYADYNMWFLVKTQML